MGSLFGTSPLAIEAQKRQQEILEAEQKRQDEKAAIRAKKIKKAKQLGETDYVMGLKEDG